MQLSARTDLIGDIAVISFSGELDLSTLPKLSDVLTQATIEGLPAASLAMLKLALLAPRLVGLKVRVIVQLPPTGTVVQPLLPIAY